MGTKNNPGNYDCYAKAEPDEPMFVLLARDEYAPMLVGLWVAIKAGRMDEKKCLEALQCAQNMVQWFGANKERLAEEAAEKTAKRLETGL